MVESESLSRTLSQTRKEMFGNKKLVDTVLFRNSIISTIIQRRNHNSKDNVSEFLKNKTIFLTFYLLY